MTKKQFHAAASAAKPGDIFRIKTATGWEYLKGWDGHYWREGIFVSYDGKEAIFEKRLNRTERIYITYRDVKIGKEIVMWDTNEVFTVSSAADLKKNNVVAMWQPGKLKHY